MKANSSRSLDTILAQISHFIDPGTGGIVPPIFPSTTFARDENYCPSSEHIAAVHFYAHASSWESRGRNQIVEFFLRFQATVICKKHIGLPGVWV